MPDRELRLFVAIYPPAEAVEAWLRAVSAMLLPRHRVTPAEQVHLTLQFIGATPKSALPEVEESVRRCVAGVKSFSLEPRRLISLPRRGPARLVALETSAPAELCEVQRRLALRLAHSVRAKAGDRFLPHLTLARYTGGGVPGVHVDEEFQAGAFLIGEVVLVRSILRPSGAEHVEVTRASLG